MRAGRPVGSRRHNLPQRLGSYVADGKHAVHRRLSGFVREDIAVFVKSELSPDQFGLGLSAHSHEQSGAGYFCPRARFYVFRHDAAKRSVAFKRDDAAVKQKFHPAVF